MHSTQFHGNIFLLINKTQRRGILKKLWYIKNKDYIRNQQKEYVKLNKGKVYTSRLRYYLKNRTTILQNAKIKYQARKTKKM